MLGELTARAASCSALFRSSWLEERIWDFESVFVSFKVTSVSLLFKLTRAMNSSELASSLLDIKFTLIVGDFLFDGTVSVVWCDVKSCCAP